MFQIGDKIVHPMHGAGVVDEIVTRKVNGVLRDYYSLKLPVGGMLVMIPTENCGAIGVRSILSRAETERVLGEISGLQVEMDTNWNHRYRENMERLKSGDLLEVAKVAKGLMIPGMPAEGCPPESEKCSTRPSKSSFLRLAWRNQSAIRRRRTALNRPFTHKIGIHTMKSEKGANQAPFLPNERRLPWICCESCFTGGRRNPPLFAQR